MSAKLAKYDRLYEQIKGYVQTTDDIWARLATMEAVLHHKMQTFFWTGVYALIDDELIVRSYIIVKTRCDEVQNEMRLLEGWSSPKRKATKISHTYQTWSKYVSRFHIREDL